ncbi:M28 family peptidase [Hymenobacter sp. 15J16-1T3B]|uniref:M28 family peptidase n=1 Tax=Hymenobacter sp. 15J16-1T3B TaxID=2886941 RepID=UPI001D106995|nr:M28 family peptidase [Hymenobacter sp. 15J16-1T3B]MCC3158147.1 M28 family peptidase [Hymenobacter sp. 15J16-1T3B]
MLAPHRRRLLLVVLLLAAGLGGVLLIRHGRRRPAARAPHATALMPADQDRLYADVKFLTDLQPARNYRNLASLNAAADYIKAEFGKLGCRVSEQPFAVDGRRYRNIIACFGPSEGERVVVGAHYDVCDDTPGADDNASAVAGLLETARLLHARAPQLTRPVELVAYPNEEPPYFATDDMGSAVHAQALHEAGVPVRAMLCYEMIGYFSDAPGSQNFPNEALAALFPSTGNFIVVVGRAGEENFTRRVQQLMQGAAQLDVQRINLPDSLALARLSDHRNYWRYGFPAVMINDTSFLRNPHYHQASDTIDTLDFRRMAEVVTGAVAAVVALATE